VQFHTKFCHPHFLQWQNRFIVSPGRQPLGIGVKRSSISLLSAADVLVFFGSSLPLGVARDASPVGIGATLFHSHPDGSERPMENISKSLATSQRNYNYIQNEASAIIYELKKF